MTAAVKAEESLLVAEAGRVEGALLEALGGILHAQQIGHEGLIGRLLVLELRILVIQRRDGLLGDRHQLADQLGDVQPGNEADATLHLRHRSPLRETRKPAKEPHPEGIGKIRR